MEFFTVCIISIFIAFLNSFPFLRELLTTEPGFVHLGVIHYWQDYFFYVSQFLQGARGALLTANQYTSEPTAASIIYWPNVLLGKIGGLFHLSPIASYHTSILLCAAAIPILVFFIGKQVFKKPWERLALVVFTMFSTSFMNMEAGAPYQLWRTPHLMFYRLGGVPLHILQTGLTLTLFLFACRFFQKQSWKYTILSSFTVMLLTTLNPVMAGVYIGGFCLGLIPFFLMKRRHPNSIKPIIVYCVFLLIPFLITSLYMKTILSLPPHTIAASWEAGQQVSATLWQLLLSMGPISILAILGIIPAIRKKQPILFISVTIPLLAYTLFLSPLPERFGITNTRVIFPALYVCLGILAVEGVNVVVKTIMRACHAGPDPASLKPNVSLIWYIILFLFLMLSIPTIQWELQEREIAAKDQALVNRLPTDIMEAYQWLLQKPSDEIVLAGSAFGFDTLVPALSGHVTYTGHMLTTINNGEKQAEANRFFQRNMTEKEAKEFLEKNHIRYILVTTYDTDISALQQFYPFLTPQSSGKIWTIFSEGDF